MKKNLLKIKFETFSSELLDKGEWMFGCSLSID